MKSTVKYPNIKQILDKNGLSTDLAKDDSIVERKTYSVVETSEGDQHKAFAIISTVSVDADGDIMLPTGFNFSVFNNNPIICWNHDYSLPPIGKATQIEVLPFGIKAEMEIETVTDFGRDMWSLVKGGFVKACSIGFIALKSLTKKDSGFKDMLKSIANQYGIDVSNCNRIILECLLMENSLVTIPSNYESMIFATKSLNIDETTIKKLHLEVKENKKDESDDSNKINTEITNPDNNEQKPENKPEEKVEPEPVFTVNIIGHILTDAEVEEQKKQLKAKLQKKLFIE